MTGGERPPADDATARNRFLFLSLARIGGALVAVVGIVVWQGDWLREGGSAVVGIPLFLAGLLVSFVLSKQLARKWRTPPAP
jgi:hypothetical protein